MDVMGLADLKSKIPGIKEASKGMPDVPKGGSITIVGKVEKSDEKMDDAGKELKERLDKAKK